MTENDYTQFESSQKEKKATKRTKSSSGVNAFTQILNGDFLTKDFVLNNLNYIVFFLFLLFLIVAKGYYGKQVIEDIRENRRNLDQNTAEYIEFKTKMEEMTRRYKMVERLKERNLVESQNAIKVIRIKPTKDE